MKRINWKPRLIILILSTCLIIPTCILPPESIVEIVKEYDTFDAETLTFLGKDDDLWTEMLSYYKDEEYQAVIELFSTEIDSLGLNRTRGLLILGLSHFKVHNFQQSISTLQSNQKNEPELEEAQRYIALCHLMLDRYSVAESVLFKLIEFSPRFKNEARKLLNDLYTNDEFLMSPSSIGSP